MTASPYLVPVRVRVQGDLFHGTIPPGAVYVGRAAPGLPASPYANPFKAGRPVLPGSALWPCLARVLPGRAGGLAPLSAADAVDAYSWWITGQPHLVQRIARDLVGRDLACWCRLPPPGDPDTCHGAVLLGLAARLTAST